MAANQNSVQVIHQKALRAAAQFKQAELDLIEVLGEVDTHRVYYSVGHPSLFRYAVGALGLSEDVAYIFINVARKAKQVPALKEELKKGTITVTKAKRLTGVITPTNQQHWLDMAKTMSKRELEREVAAVSPELTKRDRLEFVHPTFEITEKIRACENLSRVQLLVGVSEDLMIRLKRAQDVLSQQKRRSVSLEETLDAMTGLYLERKDPLAKALRIQGNSGDLKMKDESVDSRPGGGRTGAAKSTAVTASAVAGGARGPTTSARAPSTFANATTASSDSPNPAAPNSSSLKPLATPPPARTQLGPGPVGSEIRPNNEACPPKHEVKTSPPRFPQWPPKISRKAIPADIRHALQLKYQGRCGYQNKGNRCNESRFLEIHHIQPLSKGGTDDLENLILLCAGHHKVWHSHNI
ncbi:MAG: HNH endonuclease [Bdellovibrionales bacterium]